MPKRHTGSVSIIAVKDVEQTSQLLVTLFAWHSVHGGAEFDILMNRDNIPTLMLHEFDAHEHQRFAGIGKKTKGVGQSIYVFVDNIQGVYQKVKRRKLAVVEPMFTNENTQAKEFTFKLPEGYQFSVCETDSWIYFGL